MKEVDEATQRAMRPSATLTTLGKLKCTSATGKQPCDSGCAAQCDGYQDVAGNHRTMRSRMVSRVRKQDDMAK